ncbi:hypothetical protein M5K25_011613 [Dendrobium thyrsiflorum]|uniref:non-specific serine/threonine protein kinase n=1 Tax=Dendrobium thyrsiflorum TaxID=117978 RepID=A0ABD0V3K6_DENTH
MLGNELYIGAFKDGSTWRTNKFTDVVHNNYDKDDASQHGEKCMRDANHDAMSVSAAVMGRGHTAATASSLSTPPATPSAPQNPTAIAESTGADKLLEVVKVPNDAPSAKPSSPPQAASETSPSRKKPSHVKRVSSAGLMADSVLQRRTGRMKDLYSLGRKLGQGQFGTTYFCIEKATGKEFACKSIAKRKLVMREDVDDVRREIQIMHHLAGHPNVISIIDAYEDAVTVHVVMDLCVGGELFDRIIHRGYYSTFSKCHDSPES